MNPEAEIATLFQLLKKHLKDKGLSYRELAKKLEMSESNLKRIFSTQSCSFEQITQICKASGISFFDLVSTAAKKEVLYYSFSKETEDFFLENFEHFIFYNNLRGKNDIDSELKKLKTPKHKIEKYIMDLVKLKLLHYTKNGIELTNAGYLDFNNHPRLSKMIASKWVPWFLKKTVDNYEDQKKDYSLKLSSTGLKKEHKDQLIKEIDQLLEKYREIGFRDQQIGAGEFESVGICVGIGPHRIGHFEGLI